VRSRKQRSEDDSHPVEVFNTNVGSQSASQCRFAIVPDFVAVPGIAKAEGKYQVIDQGDLRDGPEESGIFHLWKF
jgi:hypothetical protein